VGKLEGTHTLKIGRGAAGDAEGVLAPQGVEGVDCAYQSFLLISIVDALLTRDMILIFLDQPSLFSF